MIPLLTNYTKLSCKLYAESAAQDQSVSPQSDLKATLSADRSVSFYFTKKADNDALRSDYVCGDQSGTTHLCICL